MLERGKTGQEQLIHQENKKNLANIIAAAIGKNQIKALNIVGGQHLTPEYRAYIKENTHILSRFSPAWGAELRRLLTDTKLQVLLTDAVILSPQIETGQLTEDVSAEEQFIQTQESNLALSKVGTRGMVPLNTDHVGNALLLTIPDTARILGNDLSDPLSVVRTSINNLLTLPEVHIQFTSRRFGYRLEGLTSKKPLQIYDAHSDETGKPLPINHHGRIVDTIADAMRLA